MKVTVDSHGIGVEFKQPLSLRRLGRGSVVFACVASVAFAAAFSVSTSNSRPPNVAVPVTTVKCVVQPPEPQGITLSGLQDYNIGPGIIQMMENQIHAARFSWFANTVRLQIVQDKLVTQNGKTLDPVYLRDIQVIVRYALNLGLYVVINPQTEQTTGYDGNEDLPTFATQMFWYWMMKSYANDPFVIFDLFNEPRFVTWSQWYVAFQSLVNYIRLKAGNIIWAEGITWASTLQDVIPLHGCGIWYSYHHLAYPWAGPGHYEGPENWQTWWNAFGYLAAKGYHVVNGEITFFRGGYNLPPRKILLYLRMCNEYHIGVVAWTLIAGVLNGTAGYASVAHEPESGANLLYDWFQRHAPHNAAGIASAGQIRRHANAG